MQKTSLKFILVLVILFCSSELHAQNLCSRLFSRVLSLVRVNREPAVLKNLAVVADVLPDIGERIHAAETKKYSTEWALFHPEGKPALTSQQQIDMMKEFNIAFNSKQVEQQIQRLKAWTQSPEHAVFIVENLKYLGSNAIPVLKQLVAESEYFKNVHPVKNGEEGLVTIAYDVEDPGEGYSMLYKTKNYTDEEWIALPYEERKRLLADDYLSVPPKNMTVPTGLKPKQLGRLTFENRDILEVKHRLFEISSAEVKKQLLEIFQIKKNTHSAHLHLVSEFPRNYEHLTSFLIWKNQLGEYLEYKGMEEGLVSDRSHFTGAESDRSITAKSWLEADNKLTGLGLRTYSYGKAILQGHIRVGLEFRDSTRNPELLNRYMDAGIKDLQTRPWEKANIQPTARGSAIISTTKYLADVGFSKEETWNFTDLPFYLVNEDFSSLKHYNFETQKWQTPDPIVLARIETAKKNLIKRIRNTLIEYRKHPEEIEAVTYALKLDLVDWAKEAKVSELFPESSRYSLIPR